MEPGISIRAVAMVLTISLFILMRVVLVSVLFKNSPSCPTRDAGKDKYAEGDPTRKPRSIGATIIVREAPPVEEAHAARAGRMFFAAEAAL